MALTLKGLGVDVNNDELRTSSIAYRLLFPITVTISMTICSKRVTFPVLQRQASCVALLDGFVLTTGYAI